MKAKASLRVCFTLEGVLIFAIKADKSTVGGINCEIYEDAGTR